MDHGGGGGRGPAACVEHRGERAAEARAEGEVQRLALVAAVVRVAGSWIDSFGKKKVGWWNVYFLNCR
jgi:hypothetical protein